ncbi:unnamed protein product [Arabidopsis arenosa]|uniref:NAC domain-containing protein n=1 Tax=Arabidopsis arenosa TaxID=38785 RepID=A0A8S1ZLI4_ARAAE|nr:unnamed protein product [Arabidopsis arenosa]
METEEEMKESSISMVEAKLPPGFRFHPKDDELVCDYLMKRSLHNNHRPPLVLIQVDLNKCEPWDIPKMACVGGKDWVFHKNTEGVICRDNMGSCFDETASASLPPLMDPYINFDQEPSSYLSDDHHFIINEHVPCFSNLSQNQTFNSNLSNSVSELKIPCKNPNPLFTGGSAPATLTGLDSFCSSDQMVLRALLSQLTKIDGSLGVKESQSYGEGSSESLLTDIGIPSSTWNC